MKQLSEAPSAAIKILLAFLFFTSISACENSKNFLLKKAFEKNAELIGRHIDKTPVHLCSELSAEEVRAIFGADYSAMESREGRECQFSAPFHGISPYSGPKEKFSVNIQIFDSPDYALGFFKGERNLLQLPATLGKGMAPQDLPQLGDVAFWVHNRQAPLMVAVADDRKYFSASVYSPSEDDSVLVGKLQSLITKLSGKIP